MKKYFDVDNFVAKLQKNCHLSIIKEFQADEIITTFLLRRNQFCVLLEGEAQLVTYDKEGNRKRVVEIVAENFKILNRSHSHQNSNIEDNNTDLLYDTLIEENYPLSENDMNLSKILAEDTELSKLGDLPF